MPKDMTVTAWTRLVRAHDSALGRIEADLKGQGLPPLAWYDALLELEKAGGDGLRPADLEGRLLLPQYGLSRLLARMEEAGYVEKKPCEDDGRSFFAAITEKGRAVRRASWPVYARALEAAIGERLSEGEAGTLAALLEKLIRPK